MKRLLMTTAALALLTSTPTLAGTAEGIALFITYDTQCEKMPLIFQRVMRQGIELVSVEELKAGIEKVKSFYLEVGPARFCEIEKPYIEKAMKLYR